VSGDSGIAVVVDDQSDSLASKVASELSRSQLSVRHLTASRLGLVELYVERDLVLVDGARLSAAFFRAGPWSRFDEGFESDDAAFASMEVSAAWLAVLNNPSVATINRLDAEVWTSRSEWPIWRRRMLAARIPCVDIDVGGVEGDYSHWLPWGGGIALPPGAASRRLFASALTGATDLSSTVWFGGQSIPESEASTEAVQVLLQHGVELAGITLDSAGRVALCTTYPEVDDETADIAAPRIAERLSKGLPRV
jgi:hypothetical protein